MRLKDLFENQSVRTALLFLGGVLAIGLLIGTIRGLDSSIEDIQLGYNNPVAEPYVITADGGGAATTTEFVGSVLPRTDNVYNLGSTLKRWANLYVASIVPGGSIIPDTDNTYDLGSLTNRWRTGYFGTSVSSTIYIAGAGSATNAALQFSNDPNTGIFRDGSDTLALTAGGSVAYWTSTAFRPAVNNTQDLGATATRFRTLYLGTSQIFSSGATGIQLYNTSDETTNYERGSLTWTGNIFRLATQPGGSGINRSIQLAALNSSGAGVQLTLATTGGTIARGSTSGAGETHFSVNGNTQSQSSGTTINTSLKGTFAQSGTAGYTMLLINPTQASVGSGEKLLADFQVGGVSQLKIDNAGYLYAGGSYAGLADGDGYYFGDSVRGLRFLTGDDFEFQNWHVGGQFYQSVFNGSTRVRYVVHDAPTKRSAFSSNTDLRNYTPTADLEVIGVASSTALMVSTSGTIKYLSVGNQFDTQQQATLMLKHSPTQAEADSRIPLMTLWNTSSTLSTPLVFMNHDGSEYLGSITAFGAGAPFNPDFGFSPANMLFMESTSGTVIAAGDGVAVFSASGAFRPITGLGFGNNDNLDPFASTASTTISNGNMSTVALDFPNSAAAGTQDLTVTVAGASAGDECQLAGADFAASLFSRANESFTCVGTAANIMTVRRTCVAGGGCGDPASVNANVGFFARQ